MANLSYKRIVQSMVEAYVKEYVGQRIDQHEYVDIPDGVVLEPGHKLVHYDTKVVIGLRDYSVHGAVTAYGNPFVTIVEFDRRRCTIDENGDWSAGEPYHKLICGEELKTFKFDA